MSKEINDNKPYGRRLTHQYQFENNLSNYDWILFGCFLRSEKTNSDWSPGRLLVFRRIKQKK